MKRVCVFCGSAFGGDPRYREAAEVVAQQLAERGVGIVYGGGAVGLMGALADAALAAGGEVVGVIPRALVSKEVAHSGLSEQHLVESMHERKALMSDLSDGFVVLPGGFGTLEELFEVVSWAQLGIHQKPIVLLDVAGFFGPLVEAIRAASRAGFIRPEQLRLILVAGDTNELFEQLDDFEPLPVPETLSKRWR